MTYGNIHWSFEDINSSLKRRTLEEERLKANGWITKYQEMIFTLMVNVFITLNQTGQYKELKMDKFLVSNSLSFVLINKMAIRL